MIPSYRSHVGPAEDYDIIAALAFNLLTRLGLRGSHRLLDVGCGSLRIGRLLIPYLDVGRYWGIEPHRRIVRAGLEHELGGEGILKVKEPWFHYTDNAECLPEAVRFDYALAQSIFSHTGLAMMRAWLEGIACRLRPTGALVATYIPGPEDSAKKGWVYPGCVQYTLETMRAQAEAVGLVLHELDWPHPRQSWLLLAAPEYDASRLPRGRG